MRLSNLELAPFTSMTSVSGVTAEVSIHGCIVTVHYDATISPTFGFYTSAMGAPAVVSLHDNTSVASIACALGVSTKEAYSLIHQLESIYELLPMIQADERKIRKAAAGRLWQMHLESMIHKAVATAAAFLF